MNPTPAAKSLLFPVSLKDSLLRELKEAELPQFLRHYVRLRLDVLLGRRTANRSLGLRFRWRLWQYERNMRRIKGREWLS